MTTDEWVELDLNGNFKVQIPGDAKAGLQEDGGGAFIRLDSSGDATEVLISNVPLTKATNDRTGQGNALRDVVADYFTRTLPKSRFTIEVSEEADQPLLYAQGVGLIEKDRMCLVRAYARQGDDRFWLVHWNGPKDRMSVVLRILVTFDPAE